MVFYGKDEHNVQTSLVNIADLTQICVILTPGILSYKCGREHYIHDFM